MKSTVECPLISVITVVLNGAKFLEETILSVLGQTYDNVEYLVIDGGSTDGSVDIIKKYQSRISYWVSEPDNGIYDAMNKGILRSTGEIINILNSDDMYRDENVISRMICFMLDNHLDFCHARVEQLDSSGNLYRLIGHDVTREQLLKKCKVAHPSVFVKRLVYNKYGVYSVGFQIAGDYEFFLRVWGEIEIDFLPEILATMRLGGLSNSNVELSYRESMAASLIHGEKLWIGLLNYYYEIIKSKLLKMKYKITNMSRA